MAPADKPKTVTLEGRTYVPIASDGNWLYRDLLQRAAKQTYSALIHSIFGRHDYAAGAHLKAEKNIRHAVDRSFAMNRRAWLRKNPQMVSLSRLDNPEIW